MHLVLTSALEPDPVWVAAVTEQASKLCHVSNLYHTEPGATLARKLTDDCFADRVFYCNSGAEANEGAIKFARKLQMQRARDAGETVKSTVSIERDSSQSARVDGFRSLSADLFSPCARFETSTATPVI